MNNEQISKLINALIDQTRAIDELVRVVDEQNLALHQHVLSNDDEEEKEYIEIKQMNGEVLRIRKR